MVFSNFDAHNFFFIFYIITFLILAGRTGSYVYSALFLYISLKVPNSLVLFRGCLLYLTTSTCTQFLLVHIFFQYGLNLHTFSCKRKKRWHPWFFCFHILFSSSLMSRPAMLIYYGISWQPLRWCVLFRTVALTLND